MHSIRWMSRRRILSGFHCICSRAQSTFGRPRSSIDGKCDRSVTGADNNVNIDTAFSYATQTTYTEGSIAVMSVSIAIARTDVGASRRISLAETSTGTVWFSCAPSVRMRANGRPGHPWYSARRMGRVRAWCPRVFGLGLGQRIGREVPAPDSARATPAHTPRPRRSSQARRGAQYGDKEEVKRRTRS